MQEIKNAVFAWIASSRNCGPRYRTLRWITGLQAMIGTSSDELREIRKLSLRHHFFHYVWIEAIHAEQNDSRECSVRCLGRVSLLDSHAVLTASDCECPQASKPEKKQSSEYGA